jgi:hypothetical protein
VSVAHLHLPDGWRKLAAGVYLHEATRWAAVRTRARRTMPWEIASFTTSEALPHGYDLAIGYSWPEYRTLEDAIAAVERDEVARDA